MSEQNPKQNIIRFPLSRRERRQLGQQVEALEHEAQLLVPHLRQLLVVAGGHVPPAQQIAAAGGHVQTPDQIHQRGLAAP